MDEWIDAELSNALSALRDRGEGQHVEFMQSYPQNGYELGKEIAAFASTNDGIILIGVADDGSLSGIQDLDESSKRDALCRRIEGVCSGNIRPAITPVIKFAREDGHVVLAIQVPRGKQPIYYCKNTPYVRHLSQSRPAEPNEVIERVAESLATNLAPRAADDAASKFLSQLAQSLVEVLIFGKETEKRQVNPWLETLQRQLGIAAEEIRRLSLSDIAATRRLDTTLADLSDVLDGVANQEFYLDGGMSWNAFNASVKKALLAAQEIKSREIDPLLDSSVSLRDVGELVKTMRRELSDLNKRAAALCEGGRVEEAQSRANQIGYNLLRAYYFIPNGKVANGPDLFTLASSLHTLETRRLYLDGGKSIEEIIDAIHHAAAEFEAWVANNQAFFEM
jgi:ATP-dependent DNA helicase RecG